MTNAAWLHARQKGIGGSDIAAILGMSKWRTALDVYLSKVTPIEEEEDEREWQFIGKELEQSVLNIYEKRTGYTVHRNLGVVSRPGMPHFLGSFDGIATETGLGVGALVVDAKTVDLSRAGEWGPDGSETCPEDLALQMLWYMGIGGFMKGDLAALIGGRNFRIITIERDNGLIEWMQSRADQFWSEHVLKGVPPSVDANHRNAMRSVNALYGKIVPATAQLAPTDFLHQILREYFTGQQMVAVGKKIQSKSKALLAELTGNNERAEITGTGIEITRKLVEKEAYTVKAASYIDLRVKLPKGTAKPLIEEAQKVLTGMATVSGDYEEEESEDFAGSD